MNWKNALFINAHGDRKRNIKRLSDSCQIIELRPNPSFFVSGRVEWVGSPEQDKKRILEKLVDALSLIYYPMPVSTTVLHVLITLLIVSYCWGRTIPGLCDKKNGPTSPFRLMSCPQRAAKPFFFSQSQCLPVDKCSPSVSKLSKHSRQPDS